MISDETLLERWRAGDGEAGAALFERHYDSVLRFFRNKVNDSARDDLIQQTFLACAEAVSRFRGASSFRTYLFGIAHNLLGDYVRKQVRTRQREAGGSKLDECEMSVTQLGQSPEIRVVMQQEQRLLLEALRRIPLAQQVALELHYWEQLTAAEIAEVVGVPLGTAKTRIRDGRHRLEGEMSAIASSAEVLRSTVDDLDRWAARVREQVLERGP